MGVDYPVAVDSDYTIWRAFENRYWPALYFVDAQGKIRHHQFGEGEYQESELIIQRLLKEAGFNDFDDTVVAIDALGIEAPADWGIWSWGRPHQVCPHAFGCALMDSARTARKALMLTFTETVLSMSNVYISLSDKLKRSLNDSSR